jgi:hypothetical protein
MTLYDCRGTIIEYEAFDKTVTVTVVGRQRIAAALTAAGHYYSDTDEVYRALADAVTEDREDVELPRCDDVHDRRDLANFLATVVNGDDGSFTRAAARLGGKFGVRDCPRCDGTGEIED